MSEPSRQAPPWLMKAVTGATLRILGILLLALIAFWALGRAHELVMIIVVSVFLALAMVPGVDALERRYHWKRGLSAAVILIAIFVFMAALILLLIPALIDMTEKLSGDLPRWTDLLNRHGVRLGRGLVTEQTVLDAVKQWAESSGRARLLDIATSSIGLIFKFFTIMMFTFLIAADEPRLVKAILGRLAPARQKRFRTAWNTAKVQTGGYFYSRLLLMAITATLTLVVMLLIGVPTFFAIPLAFFGAFFVEFIPVVGSYIGIAIPVLVTLADRGIVPALILLVWGIVYQQIHDYLLSPRISSKTMAINAGVAFASALFGASLAGPLGAIFAMPVAGMVTVFIREWAPAYEVTEEEHTKPASAGS